MSENPYESPELTEAATIRTNEYESARLRLIPFKTAIVMSMLVGFSVGAIAGAIVFCVSVFHDIDANLPSEMGSHELRGIVLGLSCLIGMPLYYALVAAIIGVLAYWPFRLTFNVVCRWIHLPVIVERAED